MRPAHRPDPNTRKPRLVAPPGACDTHLHVYGPPDRYPLAADRNYTPDPHSTLDDYLEVHRALGLKRAVVVTGSANGTNNHGSKALRCSNLRSPVRSCFDLKAAGMKNV